MTEVNRCLGKRKWMASNALILFFAKKSLDFTLFTIRTTNFMQKKCTKESFPKSKIQKLNWNWFYTVPSGKHALTFPRQKIKTATIIVQGGTVIQIVAHFVWTTRITLKVLTGAQNTLEFSLTNYSHAALRLAFHLEWSTYVTHLKQTHYSKWAVELWEL